MVYRNTYRELNEEVDSLKKKMKTLEEINKDLSSKIDEMLKDTQRMNKFPPNYNLICDSRESMCVELDEVLTIKKCKICSKTFLQNHKLGRHLKKPDEAQKFRCEGE